MTADVRNISAWFEPNASEPTVSLLFHDFVAPGSCVFDVGAFVGELTSVLSRLAGPHGQVVSFEANEAVLPQLTVNIVQNACTNVFPVNRAVHRLSGHYVDLTRPASDPAATHVEGAVADTWSEGAVETIALDDFVAQSGLVPAFCKIDIEGSEEAALQGFLKTMRAERLPLIVEHNVGDDAALSLLHDEGYRTFCSAQYSEVTSSQDMLRGSTIRNVAAVHESACSGSVFGTITGREPGRAGTAADFTRTANTGTSEHEIRLELRPGRHVIEVMLDDSATQHEIVYCEVVRNGRVAAKYHVDGETFVKNCRDIAVAVSEGDSICYRIGRIGSAIFPPPRQLTTAMIVGIPSRKPQRW